MWCRSRILWRLRNPILLPASRFESSVSKTDNPSYPLVVPRSKSELQKVPIADETPGVPKTSVFQELRRCPKEDAIYTIEQAAVPMPPEVEGYSFRYEALAQQHRDYNYSMRALDNAESVITHFPEMGDFVIIGSGLIGSATAYYTKKQVSLSADVLVIDKDPYSPHNCTANCHGLISAQSKSVDVTRIAMLSKELIRNLRRDVLVTAEDFAKIRYRPVTHLILWPQSEVEEVIDVITRQIDDGCYTETKLPDELEATFPWLKAKGTDIAMGSHGCQDECLVDPLALRNLYRTLAQAHGANFIVAEAVDFNTLHFPNEPVLSPDSATALVVRMPVTKELHNIKFAKTVLSLGHNLPYLEARSEMETFMREQMQDLHFIQPQLRIHFSFHSNQAPVINFPVITDTDGSMLMCDSFSGDFKYYLTYEESQRFFEEDNSLFVNYDLEDPHLNHIHKSKMFENYFNNTVKPKLVNRIPLMEDAKFMLAHSGFDSLNTHDSSPVVSPHPFHCKVLLSGGYGPRLMTYGPAAALALTELVINDEEITYDMTNFYWNRVVKNRRVEEFENLLK